ncbi:helix-turn-helix domain-containing protein [Fluviicola taffensis]|uniref:Putative DNA-binding protein n=1 Tax=Fluviicola taffensis (strain DSM 16823 / NCIMB 13979 / RW262) TaxID=755732 RepID=F2IJ84_FLUTR|nr:helix-turn-helix domain-containing protein [Fluviicola taffensis]AEA44954.1 putative DNA-binding protein [Fluviicola taffensis DSM 16823]
MAAQIVTVEDLEQFKSDLIFEFKTIIENQLNIGPQKNEEPKKNWLKSHQVQRLLSISPGTLQTLRLNGTLPFTKIGGVLFYDEADINRLFEDNMRNKF